MDSNSGSFIHYDMTLGKYFIFLSYSIVHYNVGMITLISQGADATC